MIPCTRVLSILSFGKERGMMSRQYRLIQLSLAGAILLCLLVGVYLFTLGNFLYTWVSSFTETIVEHTVDTNPGVVVKHWTAANMRDATDADEQSSIASDLTPGSINTSLGKAAQQEGQAPRNGNPSYPL